MPLTIPAARCKALLKRLAAVGAAATVFDPTTGALRSRDNDLEISVTSPLLVMPANGKKNAAAIAVNARQFSATVQRMGGDIKFSFTPEVLTITSAKTEVKLAALPLPTAAEAATGTQYPDLPLAALRDLLTYAASCTKATEQFAYTGAVELTTRAATDAGATLRAAATDGCRLAVTETFISTAAPAKLLVPAAAVRALAALPGETVRLTDSTNHLQFRAEAADEVVTLIARKLVAEFPTYEQHIPQTFTFRAELNPVALAAALATLAPIAADLEFHTVKLDFAHGTLRLSTLSAGSAATDEISYAPVGSASAAVSSVSPSGDADFDAVFTESGNQQLATGNSFRCSINLDFLAAYCAAVSGPITFGATSPTEPLWLTAGDRQLLIAPLRG